MLFRSRPHIRPQNTRNCFRPLRHSRGERFFVASIICIAGIIRGRFSSIKCGDRFFGCTNSVCTFICGVLGSRTVFINPRCAKTACCFIDPVLARSTCAVFFDDCTILVIDRSRFVSKFTTGAAIVIGSSFNHPQVVGT